MLLMSGVEALIILLFISSIPVIVVFIWFRLAHYPFSLLLFCFALLAGAVSFFPALLLQSFFATKSEIFYAIGKWGLVVEIFIRVAFTEEFSRLIILIIFFLIIHRLSSRQAEQTSADPQNTDLDTTEGAIGLIAGLGFAILESAVYGASNPTNALMRTFTAAPLHGACGFRVGSSITMFRENPFQAFFRFLSAVAIHGIYNFMLTIPGLISSIAAVLIALFALISSALAIHHSMKDDDAP
jgi:RsiW-degrading membrane proteinase PrsW (M82 family)